MSQKKRSTWRGAGPRSKTGKEKSPRNAITHGIYSYIDIFPGDWAQEFRSIVEDYVKSPSLTPVDGHQAGVVAKMAWNDWLFLRLVETVTASIRRKIQCRVRDEIAEQRKTVQRIEEEAGRVPRESLTGDGLCGQDRNPLALRLSVELLQFLRLQVEKRGFDRDCDAKVLDTVYGSDVSKYRQMHSRYSACREASLAHEEERKSKGIPEPAKCVETFLSLLDREIQRVQTLEEAVSNIESERLELDVCSQILESHEFERLERYKVNLERSNDRLLKRLQRLQYLRQGKPGRSNSTRKY